MGTPETHTALLVLLFGGLVVLALLAKAGCGYLKLPPLVAYIVLGLALRYGDEQFDMLAANGREILGFLASLGVIALLFRVGLESDLPGLVKQLRNALPIWTGNVTVAGLAGYLAARYLLGFDPLVSLVIATAMTATSVGIPARIWQRADQLDTDNGQRFLDVAELDDLSGVVLMGILFAILPVVQQGGAPGEVALAAGRKAGVFLAKLIAFAAACVAFSHFVEARFTRFVRKIETGPDPMLVVVGTGVLVAALAGVLGFSVAIGAFFAGLVFSRDPESVKVDASFTPLYDLFTPFFFIGVGLAIDPAHLPPPACLSAWGGPTEGFRGL